MDEKVIFDFLEEYFSLDTDGKFWIVRNMLGHEMNMAKMIEELTIIFGKHDLENRRILYKWVNKNKINLTLPLYSYLNNYSVNLSNGGWSIYRKDNNEIIFIYPVYEELFLDNFSKEILRLSFDEWMYKEKVNLVNVQ